METQPSGKRQRKHLTGTRLLTHRANLMAVHLEDLPAAESQMVLQFLQFAVNQKKQEEDEAASLGLARPELPKSAEERTLTIPGTEGK